MKRGLAGWMMVVCFGVLACAGALRAQTADLGRIDFPTSGAPQAQPHFLRGVLLLHSFEFEDAREAFVQARQLDPNFALAYWGEAMTYNHPLWREQNRDAARAALERLAPTAAARQAKAPTEREKGYLHAVEILYGEGDKVARDFSYAEAMRQLHEQYPDDLEAAAFYALAILGTTQGDRDFRTYMKAAAIAEEVFAKNPLHPGAVHYLIHSYDDPIHAPLGLRAARVYAKIAPAASHAQHMISHIYVALGDWDETVAANVKAFDVSVERAKRKGLSANAYSFHAFHWLEYGLLQQGRQREAGEKLQAMEQYARASGSSGSLWYYAAMRAGYGVETMDCKGLPASLGTSNVGVTGVAMDLFITGSCAAQTGDTAGAQKALAQLRERLGAVRATGADGTDDYATTTRTDVATAAVLEKELAGRILFKEGKTSQALALLKEATAAEDRLPLTYGPPDIVKPSHELLGEVLLELGRPTEARAQFEKALELAPRRALSLLGLARAAAQAGDEEAATKAYRELHEIWHRADAGLLERAEVAQKLSQKN